MKKRVAQREHCEDLHGLVSSLDTNSGNFLKLLHMRCKDIPWLQDELNSQLKHNQQ